MSQTQTLQPTEIARETLRRLAMRRIPPTPDNFRALYREIAGNASDGEAFPVRSLHALATELPRNTPDQVRFARQFDEAVNAASWQGVRTALMTVLEAHGSAPLAWASIIRDVVDQMRQRHANLTAAQKYDALARVLESSSSDPDQLFSRLQGLLKGWSRNAAEPEGLSIVDGHRLDIAESAIADDLPPPEHAPCDAPYTVFLRDLLARFLDLSAAHLPPDVPDLRQELERLALDIRQTERPDEIGAFTQRLEKIMPRLQWAAVDTGDLQEALLRLLRLLVDNIGELVIDDRWLRGQIDMVRDLFSAPPDLRRLNDIETRLKDVIQAQVELKKNLSAAQDRIKSMLAGFVDHLAHFTDSTGEFHDHMGRCAEKISAASDISELSQVVEEVLVGTHAIREKVSDSHQEMLQMRERVEQADHQIALLQSQLAQASQMVRHDQLTGTLNRKGLDETFQRESERSRQRGEPLCIALLDVDNFKQINDIHGHQAGDAALVHLTRTIRDNLRHQDLLARYGGEEFLIILPGTDIEAGIATLVRLQRGLTKNYFMRDSTRLLITFSAGVAQLGESETQAEAIARADAAMYEAKRAGKNRVMPAKAIPA